MKIDHAFDLSDDELTVALGRLAATEREASVALIVHLAEFDARRLYEGAGFSSMFKYCRAVLHLSEDAIYNRIEAARAARRCPAMLDMLVAGSLSLTTARLLARHLTPENQRELLRAAAGKGKDEVEELLADRLPRPDVAGSVRKLRDAKPVEVVGSSPVGAAPASRPTASGLLSVGGASAAVAGTPIVTPGVSASAPPPSARVRPLGTERYEVRFTATAEMRDKLRLAQDLLGHSIPSGDLAQVFDRALSALIGDLTRKKFAATERPQPSRGQAEGSRNIPAAVKRAVVTRDGGRCAFVSKSGHRCGERRFLEFHHVVPHAAGGKPTVDTIALRCRAHNGYEVDLFFGPGRRRTREGVGRPVTQRSTLPSTRSGTTPLTRRSAPEQTGFQRAVDVPAGVEVRSTTAHGRHRDGPLADS
jgi:hypothetical protein